MKQERLISVDFMRGITVAGMILVNNPGSWNYVYSPLEHAKWHGCTPTDLVFPFFLFIVGLSINFSLSPILLKEDGKRGIYLKILKRTLILFGLGILIAAFPFIPEELKSLRIPGVLQRIAIVFLACSIIFLNTGKTIQWIITATILILYWILMTLVPIPDGTQPNLNPGTNLGAWLDRFLLNGHLWKFTNTWDPEGVLSTLPAIGTGMLGVLVANILKTGDNGKVKALRLLSTGTVLLAFGLLWSFVFPLNKSIWTSSFVLYTGGMATIALSICYYLIDVYNFRKEAQPFIFFGANAITVYVASELFAKLVYLITMNQQSSKVTLKDWLFNTFNVSWLGPYNASLLLALLWLAVFWLIAATMYKKKIFIKV